MEKNESRIPEPRAAEPTDAGDFDPQISKISKPLGVRAGLPPIKVVVKVKF